MIKRVKAVGYEMEFTKAYALRTDNIRMQLKGDPGECGATL
jgi:hypothetical protein